MDDSAPVVQQCFAERLAYDTECNRIYEFSIAGAKTRADVVFADWISIDECMRRKRQHRLWIACPEWSSSRQQIREREIEPAGGYRSVDQQGAVAPSQFDPPPHPAPHTTPDAAPTLF